MTALVADYLWIPATTLCLLILLAITAIINRVDRDESDAGGEL